MLSKQGTEKVWHFAHAKVGDCAGAYEISVHELAKQLIREHKSLLLPALEVKLCANDAFGKLLSEQETLFDGKAVRLDECKAGKQLGSVTPDVWGMLNGREILVEVTVFHRLMPEKRQRLIETGLASFEIDLSTFKSQQATRELVEAAIFKAVGNRAWIFHPRAAATKVALQKRLDIRLAESQLAWEKTKEKREAQESEWARNSEALSVHSNATKSVARRNDAYVSANVMVTNNPVWRASFPAPEQRQAAQKALCQRLGLLEDRVAAVMGTITHRGQLATTTPCKLAGVWATELGVSTDELMRYFREAAFILG